MKRIVTAMFGLGMIGFLGHFAPAQDKKADAPKLEGKYALVAGKKEGKAIDDEAKKGGYTFTADKVTIEGMGLKFVMGYKLDAKATPVQINMEILEGPDGTKGTKAQGIIEAKGNTVKLAYSIEKDKRPKDFTGEKDFYFELKKVK